MECCENPWNQNCKRDDIELYIVVKGERKPICRHCWGKIAEGEAEW